MTSSALSGFAEGFLLGHNRDVPPDSGSIYTP
jgi:hypothetical protein